MRLARLDNMTKGWFVGDFEPTCLSSTDCEVAVKPYAAGDKEVAHYHGVATEITVIVSGRVKMFGREFTGGDIITIEPGEITAFEALTDVLTVVVKTPCVANDKYLVE